MVLVVECEWLVTPGGQLEQGPFSVTFEDEVITGIHRSQSLEGSCQLHAHLVTPGFIDLHTHGVGGGEDVMDFWQHPEYTQQAFPSQGTTSFLATVIFPRDYPEKTTAALKALGRCLMQPPGEGGGAVLEGIHAEGPIVHDLGAMPTADSNMSLAKFEELLDSIPRLKMMTISPHLEAGVGYQRIKALIERGVVPALGHDRVATEAEILGALACEPQNKMHITHLFNVCSFHHRLPSLVNFGLCDSMPNQSQYSGLSSPTIELIGDLVHVHPMVISTVLKARKMEDIIFVSDSVSEPKAGAVINYMDRQIEVADNCRSLSLVGKNVLAGSCCTLLDTFHSLVRVLNIPIGQAVSMLTENPARRAGLMHTGSVEKGKRADLLLLNKDLELERTIIAGRVAYDNTVTH